MVQTDRLNVTQTANAIRDGDSTAFRSLKEDQWQRMLKVKDDDDRSLLHTAAGCGNVEVLDAFLQHGGKQLVNQADEDGWTPLMSAASSGNTEVVQRLIACGAQADSANDMKRTALHFAASKGHEDVMRMLLNAGVSESTDCLRQCCVNAFMLQMSMHTTAQSRSDLRLGGVTLQVKCPLPRAQLHAPLSLIACH